MCATQASPQLFSSAQESCTTPASAGHVRAHVNYMCGACGVAKPSTPPSSREARWSSPRVFSGFTCSVPPKRLLHFLLPELSCVPWGDNRGHHVGRGGFQSRESLYQRICGGRSRKHKPNGNSTSSKYNTSTLNVMWKLWQKSLTDMHVYVCKTVYLCIYAG